MAEINMPGGFGGLMRFKEEYNSKFQMSPALVIVLVILAIAFVFALRFIFPIAPAAA